MMTNRDLDGIPSELQAQFLSQLLGDSPAGFLQDEALAEDEALAAAAEDAEVTIDPSAALADDSMLDLRNSPMIEDRFQALLKQHFLAKAEESLPRFPWEGAGIQDYPEAVGAIANPWLAQLQNLRAQVPENIFEQILEECQDLAQGTLKVGRQMLDAVDTLFPGESEALNNYATNLLPALAGVRDGGSQVNLPSIDYEQGRLDQQMALALTTAYDLLRQLELCLTQDAPAMSRQWLTSEGLLEVKAEWRTGADALVVTVEMPCGGRADLQSDRTSTQSNCDAEGQLELLLPVMPGEQVHTLSVRLATDANPTPLTFTIRVMG
ncbi:MAG: hypothetical protein AAF889_00615 [Cyanobacteria bacterium P01_D01_bin.73]